MLLLLGTPFSPTNIAGLQLWLDADDTATITDAGSGAVSQWNDKSGNAHHVVQATGTARPTTGTTKRNIRNVLRFDGGDVLTFTGATGVNVGACTIFIVAGETTTVSGAGLLSLHSGAGNDYDRQDSLEVSTGNPSTSIETYRFFNGSTAGYAHITASGLTPWGVYRMNHNGSAIGAYRNGTLGTPAAGRSGTYTDATGGYAIGAPFQGGVVMSTQRLNGVIGEVLVYNAVLSAGDIAAVESYLYSKWMNPLGIPGCLAWYDSSDATTITDAGAGAVSQWNDKTVNDRHLTQAQPGERPNTGTVTVNGLNALTFDGTSDHLDRAESFLTNASAGHSVFAVMKPTATGTRVIVSEGSTSQTNSAVRELILSGDNCQINVDDDANATRYAVSTGDLFDGAAHQTTWLDTRTLASVSIDRGTPVASSAYTRGTVTNTKFTIGAMARAGPTLFFQGQICEVLVFQGVLSAANVTAIDFYLGSKWLNAAIAATAAWTEEDDVFAAVESTTPTGTMAWTEADDVFAAVGQSPHSGTMSWVEEDDVCMAIGFHVPFDTDESLFTLNPIPLLQLNLPMVPPLPDPLIPHLSTVRRLVQDSYNRLAQETHDMGGQWALDHTRLGQLVVDIADPVAQFVEFPFSWSGAVNYLDTFPQYPLPVAGITIVEAAVTMVQLDDLEFDVLLSGAIVGHISAEASIVEVYDIGPFTNANPNMRLSLRLTSFGEGAAENVGIVLRTYHA